MYEGSITPDAKPAPKTVCAPVHFLILCTFFMIASLCQCFFLGVSDVEKAVSSHFVIACTLQKKLVVLTTEWLPQLHAVKLWL